MKINYIAIVLLAVSSILMSSCMEEEDFHYTDPTLVEFKNDRFGLTAQPANNTANTFNSRTVKQGLVRDSILVQLVGPQKSVETEINYVVDGPNSSNAVTTAEEGINFNFETTKGKVIIPANSSFGYIKLSLLSGIAEGETQTKRIVFTLMGNEDIGPSQNYKIFTYTITR
ncbi:hypothetical protein [Xanthocytophaga agilis]|uniref:DUF4843 domain-containing protein n=1 Tax=Xanthocytophaga agilis TaxID=3048010 RepID=A0AAE3R6A1_9BACT|nr:hypothetical protein [Xanthocytophaga agilis]MDJ1504426.1 hypothetical protein [Xanthocytophaga agilis]